MGSKKFWLRVFLTERLEKPEKTINERWFDFVPASFCKLLKAPADRMVKKILQYEIQTTLDSIACLFNEYRLVVFRIKKTGLKNQKITSSFSVFPVFFCGHFVPLVSELGQNGSSMV